MKLSNTCLFVVLFSLLLWANGCTCDFIVRNRNDLLVVDPHHFLCNEAIAIPSYEGDLDSVFFYKDITQSLARDYNAELKHGDTWCDPKNPDACEYSLVIEVNPKYSGSWVNALITWPGFIVFAPSWASYYYDAEMNTRVKIKDKKGKVLTTIESNPKVEFTYMDFDRSFWAYSGWWMPGWTVSSLLASPYMTTYDSDANTNLLSEMGDLYGEFIADEIVTKIDQLDQSKARPGRAAVSMADDKGRG